MTKLNQHNAPLPISVQTIHLDQVPVTSVAGEIDMTTDDIVRDEVHNQLAAHPAVLVLDLTKVDFLGSAGINVLIQSQLEAAQHGTRLTVVAPDQSFVSRVLATAGLKQMFDLRTDLRSAVHAS